MLEVFPDVESSHGIRPVPAAEVVRDEARRLRGSGAEVIVVLSHLGLANPAGDEDDRRLAEALPGDIDVIIGAHSHDLLPAGELVGTTLIAQAGQFAEYLGRIDIDDRGARASVIPVTEDTVPHPAVLAALEETEAKAASVLDEVIGELDRPLDAQWVAEMLKRRMQADVALATANNVLDGILPPGPVRRRELWAICDSSANPGVTTMTGARLRQMVERGRDESFVRETPNAFRGRPRGRLHVAGEAPIDDGRTYRVAGTDWELEPYGGLADRTWGLEVRYDSPTIVREAIEEDLRQ
jgi:2',3'-cyclic-nucleotide 2'-phosphodiesterase (5'-nucleotidase family)